MRFINVSPQAKLQALRTLLASVSGLEKANQRDQWRRILELMRDPMTERVTLGAFDGGRAVADYDLLRTCFENVPAMQPETAFTNRFLDTALRMPPA